MNSFSLPLNVVCIGSPALQKDIKKIRNFGLGRKTREWLKHTREVAYTLQAQYCILADIKLLIQKTELGIKMSTSGVGNFSFFTTFIAIFYLLFFDL